MFLSDRLIYLQLQKTGCTHIAKLLAEIVTGQQIRKHNRPSERLLNSGRYIVGSIRNPWDWYVSLWGYGCDQQGSLYHNLTSRRLRWREFSSHPLSALRAFPRGLNKPVTAWRNVYLDAGRPELFREWLCLLLDSTRKYDLGEKYGFSSISSLAGFLTYRYLYLFSDRIGELYSGSIQSINDLKAFDDNHNILNYTIRAESLEDDLIAVLQHCGVELNPGQIKMIRSFRRTNSSSRFRNLNYYYDGCTAELVQSKEKLIVEKYGYSMPNIN